MVSLDLSKDENDLSLTERDAVERQILETIYTLAKIDLVGSSVVADQTPYFRNAEYRKTNFLEWLEILEWDKFIRTTAQSSNGGRKVRLTGRGLQRVRMSEQDYESRHRVEPQVSTVFNGPVGQLAQVTGDHASIRQTQGAVPFAAIIPLVDRLIAEVRNHPNLPPDTVSEAEQFKLEVRKEHPKIDRIVGYLDTIKTLAGSALAVGQLVAGIRKLLP